MEDKKLYILLLSFIICILSISAINATEITTNKDMMSSDNNNDNNLETNIRYDDVTTSEENSEIKIEENNDNDKEDDDDPLTFTELNTTINNNTDSTINLSNNYKYNEDIDSYFKDGIYINRNLTIYGNGVTIDGNQMARIFKVADNTNVEFHNIKFINGKVDNGGAIYGGNAYNCEFTKNRANLGGAIYGGNAYNCTFTENNDTSEGGAIYQGNATNCTFINNEAFGGGAIYGGNAYNCNFTKNNAYYGGAINHGNAYNCTFTENEAKNGHGGAINNGTATNCTFTENKAKNGGAIYQGNATNCEFTRNIADEGGAIYRGNAYNSTFTNNIGYYGGAICRGNAYNCTFTNNIAWFEGGAMYNGTAYNCTFIGNNATSGGAMSNGDAINCLFKNNIIGGAMYGGNAILCKFENNSCAYTNIIPATINVLNYTSTYGSGERLKFNLTANDTLFDGFNTTINIYKDGLLVKTVYGLTGEGWIVNLKPGRYTAVLSLTDYPDEQSSNTTINVIKEKTTITAKPISTIYNVGKNLIITLKDQNGNAIKNAVLTVNLGSAKKYTTDANGQVKINIATLTPKTYTAKITYAESDIFNASTASVKVTVKKATPKITVKAASFKLKVKTKKYTATFKNNKNQAIKNTKVTLKVGGKTYSVKTNSKGQATFKITNLKKIGSYIAVITFPTNKYYNKVAKKVKITVKR